MKTIKTTGSCLKEVILFLVAIASLAVGLFAWLSPFNPVRNSPIQQSTLEDNPPASSNRNTVGLREPSPTPIRTNKPVVLPTAKPDTQKEVESWVTRWSEEENEDTETLVLYYEGEALAQNKQQRDDDAAQGIEYFDDELQIVGEMLIELNASETYANVQLVIEGGMSATYTQNGVCIRLSDLRISSTLSLRRTSNGWIIYKLQSTPLREPVQTQCSPP